MDSSCLSSDRNLSKDFDVLNFDVLVVGAGISGISAAYYLQKMCPNHSFAILEGRSNLGGTWDLFRYPGVRSDSDMATYAFSFRPWKHAKAVADGESILEYLEDTVSEFGIRRHIRFNHQVTAASWSSKGSMWTVRVQVKQSKSSSRNDNHLVFTCKFLYMCTGYYSYKGGYKPHFPGEETFQGTIVHPQEWPEGLDYSNTKVVVIGSGATALTLVPSMAKTAEHVTMLQRSPTYVASLPSVDKVAKFLLSVFPGRVASFLVRQKNMLISAISYNLAMAMPNLYQSVLLAGVKNEVGTEELQANFLPSYLPWKQRLCLVLDGDFFEAIRSRKASVVTDTVSSFTEAGVTLGSGSHIEADIVVTATGLQTGLFGGGDIKFVVDGRPVDFSRTWSYRGVAFSGVPNMAASYFSYVNKSWTLRADLTSQWVCKLLNHKAATRAKVCKAMLRPQDFSMTQRPEVPPGFNPGYINRTLHTMPKLGDHEPWVRSHSYMRDCKVLLNDSFNDGVMHFFY